MRDRCVLPVNAGVAPFERGERVLRYYLLRFFCVIMPRSGTPALVAIGSVYSFKLVARFICAHRVVASVAAYGSEGWWFDTS